MTWSCESCGTENPPRCAFCTRCGAGVPDQTVPPAPAPPPGPAAGAASLPQPWRPPDGSSPSGPAGWADEPAAPPGVGPGGGRASGAEDRTRSLALVALAVVAVVAVIALVVVLGPFGDSDGGNGNDAAPSTTSVAEVTVPGAQPGGSTTVDGGGPTEGVTTSAVPPPPSTTTTVAADDPAEAAAVELQRVIDADRPAVESLVGSWVPQVSSKYPGLEVGGITFDGPTIVADHEGWQERLPDEAVLLASSNDYSTFKTPDVFVTVVDQPFDDPAGANGWCDDAGLPAEDCFAKLLSHTEGPDGATVTRG